MLPTGERKKRGVTDTHTEHRAQTEELTQGRLHQEGLNKSQFRLNQGFVELGFNLNRAVLHHLILSIA